MAPRLGGIDSVAFKRSDTPENLKDDHDNRKLAKDDRRPDQTKLWVDIFLRPERHEREERSQHTQNSADGVGGRLDDNSRKGKGH